MDEETIPFAQRDNTVRDDSTQEEWDKFQDTIEMTKPEELQEIADRLGVTYKDDWEWQDYRDAFADQRWRDFAEAYRHGTAEEYGD